MNYVGINCLSIDPNYVGGVNSFTFDLLNSLAIHTNGIQYIIYCNENNKSYIESQVENNVFQLVEVKVTFNIFQKLLKKISYLIPSFFIHELITNNLERNIRKQIGNKCSCVYTSTTCLFPLLLEVPQVLSMHDAQHLTFPHFFSWKERIIRHYSYSLSYKHADVVQVSSEFIKNDYLEKFSRFNAPKIDIITEGVDLNYFHANKNYNLDVIKKYNLKPNFLFMPAQFWPHKNHLFLLRAIKILREKGIEIPIVLTGAGFEYKDEVLDYIKSNNIIDVFYLGRVPRNDLRELYWACRAFISTSLYESSSLPLREAVACGKPVFASNIKPNLEIQNKLIINFFNPENVESLVVVLENIFFDDKKLEHQVELNLEKIKSFSWNEIAKKYRSIFESLKK